MGVGGQLFGAFFKTIRIRQGATLREFCLTHNFDPGYVSKLERDIVAPPQSDDILRRYATALGLKQTSEEWQTFFDLAAAAAGKIPSDIMSDEKLVEKLPIFFRTIRNQQPTDEKLNSLLKKIREA